MRQTTHFHYTYTHQPGEIKKGAQQSLRAFHKSYILCSFTNTKVKTFFITVAILDNESLALYSTHSAGHAPEEELPSLAEVCAIMRQCLAMLQFSW